MARMSGNSRFARTTNRIMEEQQRERDRQREQERFAQMRQETTREETDREWENWTRRAMEPGFFNDPENTRQMGEAADRRRAWMEAGNA